MAKIPNFDFSHESILVVDDDDSLRETLVRLLDVLGFRVVEESDGTDALEKLSGDYTFLLTDMRMPAIDGLELIQEAHKEYPEISIISMTGFSEGYKYIDVINAGANDFIKKPFDIGELEAKIGRIINERNLREELNRLSITDSLTNLFNQRHFYSRLKEEVVRANRQVHNLTLILMDLDEFKAYNDTHGHLAGDDVLCSVGKIIQNSIRDGVDSGYRYGGDEFAVILIEADLDIAREIGRRIKDSLLELENISISLGYSKFAQKMSAKDLVSAADTDLYDSKKSNHH